MDQEEAVAVGAARRICPQLWVRYCPDSALGEAQPEVIDPSAHVGGKKGKGKGYNKGKPAQPVASFEYADEVLSWFVAFRQPSPCWGGHAAAQAALEARQLTLKLAEIASLRRRDPAVELNSLLQQLMRQPDLLLAQVAVGIHLAALEKAHHLDEDGLKLDLGLVAPELQRPMQALRSDIIDSYVGLKGSVVRAAAIAPMVTELTFSCGRCATEVVKPTKDGRFEYPSACPRKCKFARFSVEKDKCKAIDWQRIRLQEDFSELGSEELSRRVPQTVDCDFRRGMVGACVPGDSVTLYGIVRYMPTASAFNKGDGKNSSSRALFVLYLEVKAVVNIRRAFSSTGDKADAEFTPLQLEFIREIHQEPERFPLLVGSFCRQIYGQNLVKAALLLSLLGGCAVRAPGAEKRLRRRGDIHTLLLGDPGLGKSELLRALAKLTPRGVYVAGNSSSIAGLTASVVRDSAGDFALEAGALILADQGVCCIDEFDKMGADQQALLEAMEQQTVSIAKAGIVCSLPAQTTVVTAANPAKGSWDLGQTLVQNLKGVMSEALLSRFDVVFLMRDERNADNDVALSRHIVRQRMAAGLPPPTSRITGVPVGSHGDWANSQAAEQQPNRVTLQERCSAVPANAALPQELLMTYVRYARQFAQPVLGKAAKNRIKEFYLKRKANSHKAASQLPVTLRLLEALIRLSEARAKAELRKVVLLSDVEDIIEIFEAGADFEEQLPDEPIRKGKTKANNIVDRLKQFMDRRAKLDGIREFKDRELRSAAGAGVKEEDFDKAIRRLNEQENALLIKGSGTYYYVGAQ
mmetsp:Transcript_73368/g.160673  ORF Transcript_73368/g.160673 Transcript_73368/m.160673 type:complete len:806 (-) Transcript_73368:154-2571(-)